MKGNAETDGSSSHSWASSLYGAIAEQFTHFGTVQIASATL
jgi:hypothetical protein